MTHLLACLIILVGATLITLVSLYSHTLGTPFMKRIKLFNIIQGPLVAVLSSIGLGAYYDELQTKI